MSEPRCTAVQPVRLEVEDRGTNSVLLEIKRMKFIYNFFLSKPLPIISPQIFAYDVKIKRKRIPFSLVAVAPSPPRSRRASMMFIPAL